MPADRLWKWLQVRYTFRGFRHTGSAEKLRNSLIRRSALHRPLVDAAILTADLVKDRFAPLFRFREATLDCVDLDDLVEWLMDHFLRAGKGSKTEFVLYEFSLALASRDTIRSRQAFEDLYAAGNERSELAEIRDKACVCVVHSWVYENAEERIRRKDEEKVRVERIQSDFEEQRDQIQTANHLGWLAWISEIYFSREGASPFEMLSKELGEANAAAAMEGLSSVLKRPSLPTVDEILELDAQQKWCAWWLAIIAALDETSARGNRISECDDGLLQRALAIDLLHPRDYRGLGGANKSERPWKREALESRTEIVRDVYLRVGRARLQHGHHFAEGIYELLTLDVFAPFRLDIAAAILKEYPNAPGLLERLFKALLIGPEGRDKLRILVGDVFDGVIIVDERNRDWWLAGAYLIAPDEFSDALEKRAADAPDVLWRLRDLLGMSRGETTKIALPLTVAQLANLARIGARQFANCDRPSGTGGWMDHHQEWDGADFVRGLISHLSRILSDEARQALRSLLTEESLRSYREHLQGTLAKQHARIRDALYKQPDWEQTLRTLANGAPANAPDLHALALAHLREIQKQIANSNTDRFKAFWNEDSHGNIVSPKPEESCRNVLLELLRQHLHPFKIIVEPEGHMARDKRADIVFSLSGVKVVMELKRDYHAKLWTAANNQLERFYTRDPEAAGHGIYGVFWFGDKRPEPIALSQNKTRPRSASELEEMLRLQFPTEKRALIGVVVIDVSGA